MATEKRPYVLGEPPKESKAFEALLTFFEDDSFNRSEAESILMENLNIDRDEAVRLFEGLIRSSAVTTKLKESHYL